jgi:hypothetical protein
VHTDKQAQQQRLSEPHKNMCSLPIANQLHQHSHPTPTLSTAAAEMRGPCVVPDSSPLPSRSACTLWVSAATKASCTASCRMEAR